MFKVFRFKIKRTFFDMIRSGEKPEEYRDISPFYVSRFYDWQRYTGAIQVFIAGLKSGKDLSQYLKVKPGDLLKFQAGYKKDSPQITVIFQNLRIGTGKEKWGVKLDKKVFILDVTEVQGVENV